MSKGGIKNFRGRTNQGLAAIAFCALVSRAAQKERSTMTGSTNAGSECERSLLADSSPGSCPRLLQHHGRGLGVRISGVERGLASRRGAYRMT